MIAPQPPPRTPPPPQKDRRRAHHRRFRRGGHGGTEQCRVQIYPHVNFWTKIHSHLLRPISPRISLCTLQTTPHTFSIVERLNPSENQHSGTRSSLYVSASWIQPKLTTCRTHIRLALSGGYVSTPAVGTFAFRSRCSSIRPHTHVRTEYMLVVVLLELCTTLPTVRSESLLMVVPAGTRHNALLIGWFKLVRQNISPQLENPHYWGQ